jgi:PBP1b-binding outer membrane lipoprotein LpoB
MMLKNYFLIVASLLIFTSCAKDESMEDFADRLVTNLAKDDYYAFKKEMLPNPKFVRKLFKTNANMKEAQIKESLKAMEDNSEELFKRIAWRRISNDSLRQEIDWSKVEVVRVESETALLDGFEGGRVEIFFHHQGIDCSLRFRSVVRGPDGKWKIMNYGDYGCMSGRYSKDK